MHRDDERDERNRGEFSGRPFGDGDFGGPYARDTHRGAFGDDYARDDYRGVQHENYARNPRVSFRGRGPKNWRRNDESIREEINERLTEHHDIDATDVEVAVKDGEVILGGHVHNRFAKRLAEDLCYGCHGVRDVHNQLHVSDSDVHLGKASE
jgi:osmotically-inducible protein OsmY